MLDKMLRHILPKISEQALLSLLRMRCPKPNAIADLVDQHGDVKDLMDRDQQGEMKEVLSDLSTELKNGESYTADFNAAVKAVRAKKGKPPKVRLGVKPPVITEDVTEELANSHMPPGHRMWRDGFCCRWQWSNGRAYMGSKSWRKYGFVASCEMLMRDAWAYEVSPCP